MQRQIPYARIEHLHQLDTGLSASEVIARRAQYGTNEVLPAIDSGWRELLYETLRDPMLWFLLVTAALFAFTADYTEAIILLIAMLPLAGMDVYLHQRTRASTASLGGRLAVTTRVLRDQQWQAINSVDLVPGDLVAIEANEYFPADGVIVQDAEAQVDESALTGEAMPVRKRAAQTLLANQDMALDDQHWGFAGTRVLNGHLTMRVIFSGKQTLYGDIVRAALQGRQSRTPLQLAIANLVSVLLVAALVMCVLVAWVRWAQGFGAMDALISAMTLAVAALPEEFPVVFTFFLGVGVYRLAQRRALVRRAVAVENIGRITTICSDKTGTLTLGQLTLTHVYAAENIREQEVLFIAANASRDTSHDPLDLAILAAIQNRSPQKHVMTFPFTEDRKRETSVQWQDESNLLVSTKGAPEMILNVCVLSAEKKQFISQQVEALAAEGHKVIGCARRVLVLHELSDREPDAKFEWLGLLAFEDPLREGVRDSVQQCREAGIHVIMVTGDHPLTARAVAYELGMGGNNPRVALADEIENSSSPEALKNIDVIARCIPAQKLHFVQQLQAAGEIVAVTGDGVNDVPALQAADIGIAMGERGTQAAREVAAVVLLDDNFRSIVRAIAEGGQLFSNLRLSFAYLLMIHIPLVISAAVIPLAGFPLLYLPVHIVWLELIIHPTALLVFQAMPDHDKLPGVKHRHQAKFFTRKEWLVIASVGMLLTVMLTGGYQYSLGSGYNVEHARSMALAILCGGSAFVTAMLSGLKSRFSRIMMVVTLLSAIVLIQSPLATSLHLQPLHGNDWLLALTGSFVIALLARRVVA
jgi:Ca2+-transporting ATPase